MDKVYVSTPTKIAILDHEKKRTFVLRKDGLPDAGETLIMLLHQALAFTIFSIYVEKVYYQGIKVIL